MKLFRKFISLALCLSVALSAAACGPKPPKGSLGGETVDPNRTQLYVFNFAGGFGSDWLDKAKTRFESEHKDDVWEEGKKGVQIYITSQKTQFTAMQHTILSGTNEVFFGEYGFYYALKNAGILADISDIVKEKLTDYGETRSIYDKLTAEQRNYLGINENGTEHYYALPHYTSNFGFIYNVDLFDEMGYWFAKTPTGASLADKFTKNGAKSAGPDGKFETEDDGLPATYDEFFDLCDFIASDLVVPVSWCGEAYGPYLNSLRLALAGDYEGLEQSMLNYKLNGFATSLVTADRNGVLTPVNGGDPVEIIPTNAYGLARQKGWFYALDFLEKLITTDKYYHSLAFNGGYSHLDVQEDFINAGHDGKTTEMAMLMDGTWWESEATGAYNRMVQAMGKDYAKENRNFKWMPLPKVNEDEVRKAAEREKPYTLYENHNALCFIKANVADWKMPLAKEFMQFVHTDLSLREFTVTTNALRSFDYELTDTDLEKMTEFGRSLVYMKKHSDIIYPYSAESGYANNQAAYASGTYMNRAIVSGKSYGSWITAFRENGVSAADYFNGLYTYSSENPIVNLSGGVVASAGGGRL